MENPRCDVYNNMNLVLPKSLFDSLKYVELCVGGQRFDRLYFGEAYNPFVHDMYKRPIRILEDGCTVAVPLVMGGLTPNCFIPPLQHHRVQFGLHFDDVSSVSEDRLAFWADCYEITDYKAPERTHMIIQQTAYYGPDGRVGNGEHAIRLCFVRCLIAISFHGVETEFIEHVRLRSISGGVERVWYEGKSVGIRNEDRDYVVIDLHGMLDGYLVDELYLDLSISGLTEGETRTVHVQSHNYEIAVFQDGMAGLKFTG